MTTGGSAAGGARLYNLRLPSEGLRQGHGLVGRRPDLRATAHAADPCNLEEEEEEEEVRD